MNEVMVQIGVLVVLVGVFIAAFGRKFFVLRFIFGDKSMFSQILCGFIFAIIGCALMLMGGFRG